MEESQNGKLDQMECNFTCTVLPLLLFHGIPTEDNHPPNTLSRSVNGRNLDVPKFNCENDWQNLVKKLRHEGKWANLSCLDGTYIFCLTSFDQESAGQKMVSVSRSSQEEDLYRPNI